MSFDQDPTESVTISGADFAAMKDELEELKDSRNFYKRRCDLLQKWQAKMRDPERTLVCDILANGQTYHDESRYAAPPAQPDVVRDALLQGFVMVPRVLPQVVLDGFIKTGQQYSRAWAELLLKFWEHALDAALNHQSPLKNEAN